MVLLIAILMCVIAAAISWGCCQFNRLASESLLRVYVYFLDRDRSMACMPDTSVDIFRRKRKLDRILERRN